MANYAINESDFHLDVRFMDGSDYNGQADLIVGGSPCQTFSTNGKRGGFADTRGTLFHEFARIVNEVQPKCFIFENVKGLLMHNHGATWATIRNTFRELNYDIYLNKDYKGREKPLLNAKDYGVPQNRERIYLVGIRNDIHLKHPFVFPAPVPLEKTNADYLDGVVDPKYYLGKKGFEFVTTHPTRAQVGYTVQKCQKANQQFNWNGDFIFEPLEKRHSKEILERAYVGTWNGELKALRVTPRTIRIPIAQLETDTTIKPRFKVTADPSTLISKDEVLTRYAVSESLLYRKLKKENTRPRLVNGKSYLPKDTLDKILKPKPRYNPEEWYDAAEIMQSEGITRKHLSEILRKKQISCIRIGHTLLIDKKEWNTGRLLKGDIGKNHLTVDQAKKHYRIGQQTFYDKTNAAGIQGTRTGKFVYYKKSDLDRLFKDKSPKIPTEIRRNYILGRDALKHYHIGQKRFSEETQAARVTKVRTEGNFVWYKKDELDRIFNKLDIK